MSLVDSARSTISKARQRLHPNRIVFHHVPKCGGTSVGRAIRKRFLLSQATVLPEATYRAEEMLDPSASAAELLARAEELRERMFLYHLAAGVDCVSAHVRFSDAGWAAYGEKAKFVTILREPVARFISHYRYSHCRPGAHGHIPEDFETFLNGPAARQFGAFYTYFFSGLPSTADMTTGEALDRAKANLAKFHVVGFLDDTPGFESAIKAQVGVRIRIGHENKARAPKPSGDREFADLIDEITQPDQAFFAFARKLQGPRKLQGQ